MCNRTWDGWLCWDETEAGFTTEQHCPDYYRDFDPKGAFLCPSVLPDAYTNNNKYNVNDVVHFWDCQMGAAFAWV